MDADSRYRMRARDAQPTLYMTLGGIVQSLVLTYLISLTQQPKSPNLTDLPSLGAQIFWFKMLICFEIVVLVWHEYAVGLIYFWWIWDLADSLVPFVMGITQYFLISR